MSDNLNGMPTFVSAWLGTKLPRSAFGVWIIAGDVALQIGTAPCRGVAGNDNERSGVR